MIDNIALSNEILEKPQIPPLMKGCSGMPSFFLNCSFGRLPQHLVVPLTVLPIASLITTGTPVESTKQNSITFPCICGQNKMSWTQEHFAIGPLDDRLLSSIIIRRIASGSKDCSEVVRPAPKNALLDSCSRYIEHMRCCPIHLGPVPQ